MRAGDAEEEKTPTLITLYRFRLSAGVAVCLTGASEVNNEGLSLTTSSEAGLSG